MVDAGTYEGPRLDTVELTKRPIATADDVVLLRRAVRACAQGLRLRPVDQTKLAAAVSEGARAVLEHFGSGAASLTVEDCRFRIELRGKGPRKGGTTTGIEPNGASRLVDRIRATDEGLRIEQSLSERPTSKQISELRERLSDHASSALDELREQNQALIASLEAQSRIDARLSLAIETADLGILSVDPVSGSVEANARAQALHGGDSELEHLRRFELWPEPEPRSLEEHLGGHLETIAENTFETTYRTRTGRWVFLRARKEPGTHRVHATLLDVTRTKEEEAAQRKLAEMQQMMMGVGSHDLRSPLQTIRTGATLLRGFERIDDDALRILARMEQSSAQAGRIVSDFFDYTQAQVSGTLPVVRERCDLYEIAESAAGSAHVRTATAEISVAGDSCVVLGDRQRLDQAVTNLLDNALSHGESSTSVRVLVGARPGYGYIAVQNQGPPIPEDELAHVFVPFRRGRSTRRRGLGLGLHIVQLVAAAHGGEVRVQSTENTTTFEIRLPISASSDATL